MSDDVPASAARAPRAMYWDELKKSIDTPVYDGIALKPGNRVLGPTVVETPDTSVVVRPGQALSVDALGNFELHING